MKLAFIILISLLIVKSSFSQNPDFDPEAQVISHGNGGIQSFSIANWSSLPNSPSGVSRSCCVYIKTGNVPYLYQFGGGNSTNELRRVARLNLNTNTWTNNYSTMPFSISAGTALAFRGDSIVYVFGGNSPTLGKTLKYNVYANSWSTVADMPVKITDALVIKYNETYAYVIGGGDGYFGASALKTNAIQLYNTYTNSYSTIGTYPINCAMLSGGIYLDTIISIGGYTNGGVTTSACYKGVINPVNHFVNWISIAAYPAGPILRLASGLVSLAQGSGILCTGGALNGVTPIASTYMWNFCTQSWQFGLPNNSLARSNFKGCGAGDASVYVVAGFTNAGVGTTEKLTFSFIDGPCSIVGVEGNINSIPAQFKLNQNFPNPFNPSTVISFDLPKAGNVKLTINDINGREAIVLTDKYYSAGKYSIEFKPGNLSSGIYFYTLESADFTQTRKMLMIK